MMIMHFTTKWLAVFTLLFISACINAQKEQYDLLGYTPPSGWKKETHDGMITYSFTNGKDKSWCQLLVYQSVQSKGTVEADFTSEWNELMARSNNITAVLQMDADRDSDGWILRSGGAPFQFNSQSCIAYLTVFSGYGRCVSILMKTNKQDYINDYYALMSSLEIRKPAELVVPVRQMPEGQQQVNPTPPTVQKGFHFTTTNFDDGWTSTAREDWVEATKGNIKVLVHYTNSTTNQYVPDREELNTLAWNTFIVPRYSNLLNFEKLKYNMSYEQVLFMGGDLTDQQGTNVFVALFHKGGKLNNWIEIICPSRAAFTQAFGIDKYDSYFDGWDALAKLSGLNRFAVATADLKGKWTTSFTGFTQYVNVYTGADAGTSSHSSTQYFDFASSTYKWEIKVASGMVGNMKFQGAKSSGQWKLPDNWKLYCSDIEGKPRTYPVFFTCAKDARVLWVDGTAYAKAE